MSPIKNRIRLTLRALLFGVSVLSIVVLWALNSHLKTVVVIEQGNPQRMASQLQIELLRLKDAIHGYVEGAADAQQVVLRFEIAWGSINVMQLGEIAEFTSVIAAEDNPINSLEELFEEVEPGILALASRATSLETDVQTLAVLQDNLSAYDLELRRFTVLMSQAKIERMVEFRNNALMLLKAASYSFAGLMAVVATFAAFLLFDRRESRVTTLRLEKLAEDANAASAAKDKFMSSVSHELRTPLTSIRGAIGILKGSFDKMPAEQVKNIVNIAERNSDRLLTLVNDILDAQRVSENNLKLKLETADISEIVRTAVEDCEAFAEQMNVTYRIATDDSALMVRVDKSRISQVVCNLLSNAAKYSKPQDEIIVRAFSSGGMVTVEVEDHGIGIAESEHANIFTRFHQVNPGETSGSKSSGLGLSISKELIELHGGEISFTSVFGQGSTFRFSLKAE